MRPYEGLKVLDLTHVLAGPFGAYQLAVLGADVIKIEEPGIGDQVRTRGPERTLHKDKMGVNYLTQASNKRCLTLDLKQPAGQAVLKRMAEDADVLIENMRSGVLAGLGLGYEDLKAVNPKLIYCSLTAYGQDGPKGPHPAYDHVVQACSGLMEATGTADSAPLKMGTPVLDYASGTMVAFAVASALFQRERTGEGQHVDVSMMDTALIMMGANLTGYFRTGKAAQPKGNDHHLATSSCYMAKDRLVMLAANTRGQISRLLDAIGRPDLMKWADDDDQMANRDAFAAALREKLAEKTAQEWEDQLNNMVVPCAVVRTVDETMQLAQLESRAVTHRHESVPGLDGAVTVPLAAFKFAHGGPSIETPPRALGADSDAVLAEYGYDAAAIEALRADGVV